MINALRLQISRTENSASCLHAALATLLCSGALCAQNNFDAVVESDRLWLATDIHGSMAVYAFDPGGLELDRWLMPSGLSAPFALVPGERDRPSVLASGDDRTIVRALLESGRRVRVISESDSPKVGGAIIHSAVGAVELRASEEGQTVMSWHFGKARSTLALVGLRERKLLLDEPLFIVPRRRLFDAVYDGDEMARMAFSSLSFDSKGSMVGRIHCGVMEGTRVRQVWVKDRFHGMTVEPDYASMSFVADMNGDGIPELAVGCPETWTPHDKFGSIILVDGESGDALRYVDSPHSLDMHGFRMFGVRLSYSSADDSLYALDVPGSDAMDPDMRERFPEVTVTAIYRVGRISSPRPSIYLECCPSEHGMAHVYGLSVGEARVWVIGTANDDSVMVYSIKK